MRTSAARALTLIRVCNNDPLNIENVKSDEKIHEEYKVPSEEEEDTSEFSGYSSAEEETSKKCTEKQTKTVPEDFNALLSSKWAGYYKVREQQLKQVPKEMFAKWREEFKTKKTVMCTNEGCGKRYTTFYGLKYHAERCFPSIGKDVATCLICKTTFVSVKFLFNHMNVKHENMENIEEECNEKYKKERNNSEKKNKRGLSKAKQAKKKRELSLHSESTAYTFHLENDAQKLFPDWEPEATIWIPLSDSELKEYLPLQKHSVNIQFEDKDEKSKWMKLQLFESFSINESSPHRTFFIGGPVWAGAWCPTPVNVSADQYIALSYCKNAEELHSLIPHELRKTLIEIWWMGNLPKDGNEIPMPTLRLGIAVDHGEIWKLSWCPSGCWENPLMYLPLVMQNDKLPRLGLLATACSDSCVRIYSIPHPLCLHRNYLHSNSFIYHAKPVMLLKLPSLHKSCLCNPGICTSLSWQTTDGCRNLAAGFSNGLVSCWDLCSTSPLLTSVEDGQNVLLPYTSFFGAPTCITDLCWSPYKSTQFLAVASLDKHLKIWDLKNPCVPISFKLGILRSLHWSHDQQGLYVGNEVNQRFEDKVQFVSYTSGQLTTAAEHNATLWSITMCDWHNIIVSGDMAGEVIGAAFQDPPTKKKEHRWKCRFPIYRMNLKILHTNQSSKEMVEMQVPSPSGSLDSGIHENTEEKLEEGNCKKDSIPDETYKDITQNYGLVISDFGDISLNLLPAEENERLKIKSMNPGKIESYPLMSVNLVLWNPNYGYSSWLFSAGQAGLARLNRVKNAYLAERNCSDEPDVKLIHSQDVLR